MLTREAFIRRFMQGIHLLDGATGTRLLAAGMPRKCCTEAWILDHPETLLELQQAYANAGSEIIYAPTFRAQPIVLAEHGLAQDTERINCELVALSRSAAPDCLIAGNMTTLRGYINTSDPNSFSQMVSEYRRQIAALITAGIDLLAAETLLHPQEARAILSAAEAEGAPAVMVSFTCKTDGQLYSGHTVSDALREAEQNGAAAVGINCIAADEKLPDLIEALREHTTLPLLCKPNAGRAVQGMYSISEKRFVDVTLQCAKRGANLLGGCCGTDPAYIQRLATEISALAKNV